MTIKRLIRKGMLATTALVFAAVSMTSPLRAADVGSAMGDFWQDLGGQMNYTAPGKGQAAGYYTGGGLYMRTPIRNTSFVSLSAPSYRAGCGGIDLFGGAFSHISAGEFISTLKAVVNNASGAAFKIGLETISPILGEVMGDLNDIMSRINQANMNSCESAQNIVGAMWPQIDESSRSICSMIGNRQGFFADMAQAKHKCGNGGERVSTLSRATGPAKDMIPVDRNPTWEALKGHPLLSSNPELMKVMHTLLGTAFFRQGASDDAANTPVIIPPRPLDKKMIGALLTGGTFEVHQCTGTGTTLDKCIDVSRLGTTVTIASGKGFQDIVTTRLDSIAAKIRNRQAIGPRSTDPDADLLNITTLPIHKMLAVQTAYQPMASVVYAQQYAEVIALDILFAFLRENIRMVEESGAAKVMFATEQEKEGFYQSIRISMDAITRERSETMEKFNREIEIVEKTQFVEQALLGRLGSRLAQSVAFSKDKR